MLGRNALGPAALALLAGSLLTPAALAGGSPENALLIIDPTSAESMYIGNYYKNARNIPDTNVLYLDPDAPGYADFVAGNLKGLLGTLENRALADHIDYAIVAPGPSFFISAPNLVNDQCWPVARFAMSSVFTMAYIADTVAAGGVSSQRRNHYHSVNLNEARAFDSTSNWYVGSPSSHPSAERYLIGAMLGYTGPRGNTVAEILSMIDRSVAADATHPAGAFYYMNNPGDPARNVRATGYSSAAADITARGGQAQVIDGILPASRHDCLGIMTGAADPAIESEDMTLLAGSFADHLTSYAATFDNADQTKLSSWIRRGASGSAGAVEEPCNYNGKFPHPRFHPSYFQGLSLGEAYFRSMQYVPFQTILIGDPLTRPFAHLPTVGVTGFPSGPVGGNIQFTAAATTTRPDTFIASYELFVDGVSQGLSLTGLFALDTTQLPDGWHDVRVIAYDSTFMLNAGRWVGALTTNNRGLTVSAFDGTASGPLDGTFTFNLTPGPGAIDEVRLLHNGRVIAAQPTAGGLTVRGRALGAGTSRVQAEVLYTSGQTVRTAPRVVTVSNTGSPTHTAAPVVFSYTKVVLPDEPFVVELPASFNGDPAQVTYTLLSSPADATVIGGADKPYRIMQPDAGACGTDQFTFRAQSPAGQSAVATVTLVYDCPGTPCRADLDGSGTLTLNDFITFRNLYTTGNMTADFDDSGALTLSDFLAFRNAYTAGCP